MYLFGYMEIRINLRFPHHSGSNSSNQIWALDWILKTWGLAPQRKWEIHPSQRLRGHGENLSRKQDSKIPTNHSRYLKTCEDQKIYVGDSESVYLANRLDQQIGWTQAHPFIFLYIFEWALHLSCQPCLATTYKKQIEINQKTEAQICLFEKGKESPAPPWLQKPPVARDQRGQEKPEITSHPCRPAKIRNRVILSTRLIKSAQRKSRLKIITAPLQINQYCMERFDTGGGRAWTSTL